MSPAESAIVVLDDPAVGFDHRRGEWRSVDMDMDNLVGATDSILAGLGSDEGGACGLCVPCAYFQDNRCYWCPEPDDPAYPSDRPECRGCLGTKPPEKPPWYRREDIMVPLITSITVSTAAAVLSSLILKRAGYD